MEEIHHFGLTIHEQARSRAFYAGVLGLPWMGEFVNRGERFESMYMLKEAVNRVTWYQIGREGMETFYLPRHPAYTEGVGDIGKPGYRYISFWVDGFEKFIERLGRQGLEIRMGEGAAGPCSRICDPDGMNIILFDSGRAANLGHISSLKEIGLVVSDAAGYGKFFEVIGLWRTERESGFLDSFIGMHTAAPLYGNVRLIALNDGGVVDGARPISAAAAAAAFNDIGIKHVAYSVPDVDEFYADAKRAGVNFLFAPMNVPGGSRIAYFLDPEGNVFEAMQLNPVMKAIAGAAGAAAQMIKGVFSK